MINVKGTVALVCLLVIFQLEFRMEGEREPRSSSVEAMEVDEANTEGSETETLNQNQEVKSSEGQVEEDLPVHEAIKTNQNIHTTEQYSAGDVPDSNDLSTEEGNELQTKKCKMSPPQSNEGFETEKEFQTVNKKDCSETEPDCGKSNESQKKLGEEGTCSHDENVAQTSEKPCDSGTDSATMELHRETEEVATASGSVPDESVPSDGASLKPVPSYKVYKNLPDQSALERFNYMFNEDGELRHIKKKEPYNFVIKPDDHGYNQKQYEELGEEITEYVYKLLEERCHLKKVKIPVDAGDRDPQGFFFMSEDALTNDDKLLVLIHGSGVVRAGQWTRKLIINNSLEKGTQIPYIERGKEEGYGVIVLNGNLNTGMKRRREKNIKGSESPEDHGEYVWENFIHESKAAHICFVAHSYGGVVTLDIAKRFPEQFVERVAAVAFTDSVHMLGWQKPPAKVKTFFLKHCRNWVSSSKPLDTKETRRVKDCPAVSAGTPSHEWTSTCAFESVFPFLKDEIEKKRSRREDDDDEVASADEATELDSSDSGDSKRCSIQ